MALTKTRSDLVNQALNNLGILAAGQTASTEDYDAVDGYVDQVFASLDHREIVTVTDDGKIPVEWFTPLAEVLANAAATEFGGQNNPALVVSFENQLRELTRGKPTYEPLRIDYF